MATTAPNLSAIHRTLKTIEENITRWNQSSWIGPNADFDPATNTCGTTYCFAGWAIVSDPAYETSSRYCNGDDQSKLMDWDCGAATRLGTLGEDSYGYPKNVYKCLGHTKVIHSATGEEVHDWEDRALKVLGLEYERALVLFNGDIPSGTPEDFKNFKGLVLSEVAEQTNDFFAELKYESSVATPDPWGPPHPKYDEEPPF